MNAITIEIHYTSASRLMQRGSFPLKGRRPEQVALAFWKEIRKQMSNRAELERAIVNGDQDITELVADIEREELRNIDANWSLPF
ncbi:hypothetical protein COJ96_04210 [Bacillus sp. AFS073361]|uniref:hypothetical protein n=1 Tax=Bacillus sp. AFS073361 TaxID=2033511 RepID=UPI000BF721B7|nr:hypothetical protein [Bacillus sp. AFS073361]PFP30748.1 hypothetical protein COJ96_04210 [Bacillus sp. AFS073361]